MGSVVAVHGCCEPQAAPGSLTPGRRVRGAPFVVSGSAVQVAATEIFNVLGVGAYHTSVVLGDKEYYFDEQGIVSAPALWSHQRARRRGSGAGAGGGGGGDGGGEGGGEGEGRGWKPPPVEWKTEVTKLGDANFLDAGACLRRSLGPFFEKGSYDVLHKNCNAFSDAAVNLLTGNRLDPRYSRLERMFVATKPFSVGALNQVLRMGGTRRDATENAEANNYVANPLAENFSVDALLANGEVWKLVRSQTPAVSGSALASPRASVRTEEDDEEEDDVCYADSDGIFCAQNIMPQLATAPMTGCEHCDIEKLRALLKASNLPLQQQQQQQQQQ